MKIIRIFKKDSVASDYLKQAKKHMADAKKSLDSAKSSLENGVAMAQDPKDKKENETALSNVKKALDSLK